MTLCDCSVTVVITESVESSQFRCDQCGKVYKHKCNLLTHRRYECGTEPRFPCPFCPYRAKRRTHLKGHCALKHKVAL
ncbi:longitudinals lacking protein, isoforms A/B/D/L-like [Homalodisca vitripennis]|uniref:longitudinals lacking protein, isoforms A/B/D/L-like n=1 Tax=Homalodisca vitripennis TaxID=197043 RepID=UPI001EEA9B59|nr:longitudinals lacking protein, isoforms A/B/D/L-like [Homalodisca vitripennis]